MVFGDTLLVHEGGVVTFEFFKGQSVLKDENTAEILAAASPSIDTEFSHGTQDGKVVVLVPKKDTPTIGYVTIRFDCGLFFEKCQPAERPEFKYLISRP
jgi:hypothetical protein